MLLQLYLNITGAGAVDREFVYIVILSSGWVVGSGKRAGGRVAGGGPGSGRAGERPCGRTATRVQKRTKNYVFLRFSIEKVCFVETRRKTRRLK